MEPAFQATQFIQRHNKKSNNTKIKIEDQLFLLNEEDYPYNQHGGAWSLTISSREHEVLKGLEPRRKLAMRIIKYLLQTFIVENSPDIDPDSENYVQVSDKKVRAAPEICTIPFSHANR